MKKLIPAICMLLISAVMLGTSTFAWFSMNTTVDAKTIEISVKSNNTYLLISDSKNTATGIQTDARTSVTYTDNQVLFPAAYAKAGDQEALLADRMPLSISGKQTNGSDITTASAVVTNTETASTVSNWYTGAATASDAATLKADTARQLTSFDSYVIKKTVYLTIAQNANAAKNLTVTPTFTALDTGKDITGAKVLMCVQYDDVNEEMVELSSGSAASVNLYKAETPNITDTTVVTITFFVFYDGNVNAVKSNNFSNLTGAKIDLQFDVVAA